MAGKVHKAWVVSHPADWASELADRISAVLLPPESETPRCPAILGDWREDCISVTYPGTPAAPYGVRADGTPRTAAEDAKTWRRYEEVLRRNRW